MEYTSHSEKETELLGAEIAAKLRPGDVIALRGGLGAGKTAFTRGLARGLGITGRVTSPTFTIVNEYSGNLSLFHFDLYRLAGPDDLDSIGFYEYLDRDGVSVIEWSEVAGELLPPGTITVTLEHIVDTSRKITVEGQL